ncbi:MAG: hypothetical protein KY429_10040 [Actinobacteria bacterium]|nr:hypothetical protein [Actinomycetota bacterium]
MSDELEERVRRELQEAASAARTSPDAWRRTEARIGRRPWRLLAAASGVLALVLIGALAFQYLPQRDQPIVTVPAEDPPGAEEEPTPAPQEADRPIGPAFWPSPFRESASDVEDWRFDRREVAIRFTREFIGWQRVSVEKVSEPEPYEDEPYEDTPPASDSEASPDAEANMVLLRSLVHLNPYIGEDGSTRGVLHTIELVGIQEDESSTVWYVAGITSPDTEVTEPFPQTVVDSPLNLKGRGRGYEATLHVEIRDDAGTVLHPREGRNEGYVMAGQYSVEPFEAKVEFSRPSREWGILIITSSTGLEGPAPAWSVVRIYFRSVERSEPTPSPSPAG